MLKQCHLRIARPTNRLDAIVEFYVGTLGFEQLGEFRDHDGFDGVMVGHSVAPYHLEFTQHKLDEHDWVPSQDHLLVFYIEDYSVWEHTTRKIESLGADHVVSQNPYWDRSGKTYEDPDGYRIVIQHGSWQPLQ